MNRKKRNRRRFLLIALCALVLAAALTVLALGALSAPASAQQKRPLTFDDFATLKGVSDPQLSPDGKQIIYTRRWVDKLNDRWESSLWIMNVDGTRNRALRQGSGARSPRGRRAPARVRGGVPPVHPRGGAVVDGAVAER